MVMKCDDILSIQGLIGGDDLDETGTALNTMERAEAAYSSQVELIGRSDNAISETLTFGLTNAKQIGKTLGTRLGGLYVWHTLPANPACLKQQH